MVAHRLPAQNLSSPPPPVSELGCTPLETTVAKAQPESSVRVAIRPEPDVLSTLAVPVPVYAKSNCMPCSGLPSASSMHTFTCCVVLPKIGFGLAVPALNILAAGMFPAAADRAVLYLNALLGLGTALAPLLVAVFLGLGVWWGLPLMTAILLAVLIVVSLGLPLASEVAPSAPSGRTQRPSLPPAFRMFAIFALLYGIVETMNGNWSTVYMTGTLGASAAEASLALTAFWGMVTVGRILFAAIERWLPEPTVYRLLPFVAALALATTAQLSGASVAAGVLVFGLAGLGCSALLPLTISFSQRGLAAAAASAAGLIIAFYQVGYGIAAFGVGPLPDLAGISLSALYGVTAIVAVVLGVLAFVVVPRRPRAAAGVPADA